VEDPQKVIEQVGRRIAELRERADLTQAEIAERVEMTVTNYQRIEHGHQNATIATLVKIAGAIGVPVSALWQDPERARAGRGRPVRKK
jgi:transcriptional regulator with XRE-family HTH domain